MMYPCVFIIFSLVLLCLESTSANQLVAVEGGGGDDNGVVKKCLDKERHALLRFKAGLQDPDGSLSEWTAEQEDCCRWPGVTCNNQTGHVTQLDFSHCGVVVIEWQGAEREFIKSNLGLLNSIDLSSNSLTGQIPYELTKLYELVSLNLSHNSFLGEIPQKVGRMKKLLTLDLSRNSFAGGIPTSMSQMTLLNVLDLSFNNLSGRIPLSTQLQSFEPSRYDGNAGLCGPPLIKTCPGDEDSKVPSVNIGEREGDGEATEELWGWFYIGGGIGFVTGFWIACGVLLLNHRGRRAFFQFYDSFRDWVYVKVVVFIANFQRVEYT